MKTIHNPEYYTIMLNTRFVLLFPRVNSCGKILFLQFKCNNINYYYCIRTIIIQSDE